MPKSHFRAKFYNLESLPAVNLAPPSTAILTPLLEVRQLMSLRNIGK